LLPSPDRAYHHILVCMFRRNKLYNVGLITHNAQDKRTKSIRQNIAHALLENTVPQDSLERLHSMQLLLQVMMAARSTKNQARLAANALGNCFIRSGIAGVQC